MARGRERNPFGIRTGDILVLGGVVIAGAALLGRMPKLEIPELPAGSGDIVGDIGRLIGRIFDTTPAAAGQPVTPPAPGNPAAGLRVDLVGFTFPGRVWANPSIEVSWVVNHMGPAASLWAGVEFYEHRGDTTPRFVFHEPFSVESADQFWSYTITGTTRLAGISVTALRPRAFIADGDGNVLAEQWGVTEMQIFW